MDKIIYLIGTDRLFMGTSVHPIDVVASASAGKTVYTRLNDKLACEDGPVLTDGQTAIRSKDYKSWVVINAKPSDYHELIDGEWVLNDALEKAGFNKLKTQKQIEVSNAAQAYIDAVTNDFAPIFERESYLIQAAESADWMDDKTAATPVLDGIATARGVNPDILKAKAYQKSQQYQVLCATVTGLRQKLEDAVNAASTMADLDAIQPAEIFKAEL